MLRPRSVGVDSLSSIFRPAHKTWSAVFLLAINKCLNFQAFNAALSPVFLHAPLHCSLIVFGPFAWKRNRNGFPYQEKEWCIPELPVP